MGKTAFGCWGDLDHSVVSTRHQGNLETKPGSGRKRLERVASANWNGDSVCIITDCNGQKLNEWIPAMELEQRINEVETRLAFQETMLQELNEALTSQQQQLSQMQAVLEKLRERIVELASNMQPDAAIEPPPPHY
jgi:SlyX protein